MHPLAEYPRPAMRRDSCEILNGPWQYAITQTAEYPAAWQGSILVPYSPEAPASGVWRSGFTVRQTGIEISSIPSNLIIVIFYYQISLKPLKTLSLSQVSFPLLFPSCYIVPSVFTNSHKGKKNL